MVTAADLPESGDAGNRFEPAMVPRFIQLGFIRERRSRPYQAHLAPDDVDELRQFVQAEAAQDSSRARDAGVVGQFVKRRPPFPILPGFLNPFSDVPSMRGVVGIGAHRAKFQHLEMLSAYSHSRLPKQDWTSIE